MMPKEFRKVATSEYILASFVYITITIYLLFTFSGLINFEVASLEKDQPLLWNRSGSREGSER